MGHYKRNGFRRPFHTLQILSWILMILNIGASFGLLFPVLCTLNQIIFGCSIGLSYLSILVLGYMLTSSDPTDYDAPLVEAKTCGACERSVHISSKHCRKCNRCVARFDHHCKWVNNCVGKKNFKLFSSLLVSVFTMFLILAAQTVYIMYDSQYEPDVFRENVNHVYEGFSYIILGAALILCVESIIFIFLVAFLILFHLWLVTKGITTYEYLVGQGKTSNVVPKQSQSLRAHNDE